MALKSKLEGNKQLNIPSSLLKGKKLILEDILVENTNDLLKVYKPLYRKYKATPRSLLYYSFHEGYEMKIAQHGKILKEILAKNPEIKILDIGCGYGSLAAYIPSKNYIGIDIIEEFIQEAQKNYPDHSFFLSSLEAWKKKVDISVLAGVMGSVPQPFSLLQKAWNISNRGLLIDFNDEKKIRKMTKIDNFHSYDINIVEQWITKEPSINYTKKEGHLWNIYFLQKL